MRIQFPEGSGILSKFFTSIWFRVINILDRQNASLTTYRVKKLELNGQLVPARLAHRKFEHEIGIVIQGAVIPSTTYRICLRYKSLYPEVRIVLSTWSTESQKDISKIRELGIHVIENVPPELPGPGNINSQIYSTRSGIEHLSHFPVRYILKNRSDCWLSSDYFLEYLYTLIVNFSQKDKRIVVPSYNSFLFRMYSPSDQIQFGSLEVLKLFWDCEFYDVNTQDYRFAESYLLRSALAREGVDVKNSIEDSLEVYRDKFIIADNEQLGLVLNKGTKQAVGNRWAKDGYPQPMSEIQFWHWLELQTSTEKIILDYRALLSDKKE